ncbi:SRPBCC domain-containing protein [Empedobacter brevis]|uniref:SRPBCC domain-containing protein n=1 Tax=Empedobacter brevis TaxID=247 RepID=UPI0039AFA765
MEKDDVLLNISIDGSAENVWKVLTDEQTFNKCFAHIKMKCKEWKVGEKLEFETQKNNEIIVDEAIITSILENERLRYNYKKQNTNHEIEVNFSLQRSGNFTYLAIEGRDFADEFERSHFENSWINMMQTIKKFVQNKEKKD